MHQGLCWGHNTLKRALLSLTKPEGSNIEEGAVVIFKYNTDPPLDPPIKLFICIKEQI